LSNYYQAGNHSAMGADFLAVQDVAPGWWGKMTTVWKGFALEMVGLRYHNK
jgi:hypothetical protein